MYATFCHVVLLLSLLLSPAAGAATRKLPKILKAAPKLEDYDLTVKLPGTVHKVAELRHKPRAVVGYLSDKDWALMEFTCMMYTSWQRVSAMAYQQYSYKIDLIVFSDDRWAPSISQFCIPLEISMSSDDWSTITTNQPQCFIIKYPPPPQKVWHGYPFINNVHFFADPLVASKLLGNYAYLLKTDFDAFLSPALANHFPGTVEAGYMEYQVVPYTGEKLTQIAKRLGLHHAGKHNIGPTWYGDTMSIISMANFSIPIMYEIYMKEFEHYPEGGLVQKWYQGEGWPEWSGGGIAMYATELAFNHIFEDFVHDKRYDHHGDSDSLIRDVMQIHCRHGDGDFNKFTFFQSHYDGVDLSKLEVNIVKDYAMHLAVTTWRMLNKPNDMQQQCQPGEDCE